MIMILLVTVFESNRPELMEPRLERCQQSKLVQHRMELKLVAVPVRIAVAVLGRIVAVEALDHTVLVHTEVVPLVVRIVVPDQDLYHMEAHLVVVLVALRILDFGVGNRELGQVEGIPVLVVVLLVVD